MATKTRERWLWPFVGSLDLSSGMFVDVGCNTGEWLEWLLGVNPGLSGLGFEPNPATAKSARERSYYKDLADRCEIITAGIGAVASVLRLYTFENHANCSFQFRTDHEPRGSILAPVIPLSAASELIGTARLSFLKIDTEGFEAPVLESAGPLLLSHGHCPIVCEVHSVESGAECASLLCDFGYDPKLIRHPHYAPNSDEWRAHYWIACEGLTDD